MKYYIYSLLLVLSFPALANNFIHLVSPKQGEGFTEEMLIRGTIEGFTPGTELFFSATQIPIDKDGKFDMYLELAKPGENEFYVVVKKNKEFIYRRLLRVNAQSQGEKIKSNFVSQKPSVSRAVVISTVPQGAAVKYNFFDLGKTPVKVFDLAESGFISIYKEGFNEIRQKFAYPVKGENLTFTLVQMSPSATKVSIQESPNKKLEKTGYYKITGKISDFKKDRQNSVLVISEPNGEYEFKDIESDGSFEWIYSRISSPGDVYFRYTQDGKTSVSNKIHLKFDAN